MSRGGGCVAAARDRQEMKARSSLGRVTAVAAASVQPGRDARTGRLRVRAGTAVSVARRGRVVPETRETRSHRLPPFLTNFVS